MVQSQIHGSGVHNWNVYEDIRGSSAPWDDMEHVGPGMPTIWNMFRGNDDSQHDDCALDLGLDLSMSSGADFYR
jgi:hypothetical protein